MNTLESITLSYLANALWQVPLIWAAGWLAARVLRPFGPGAEHRVWVGVLLLQAILPAASGIPWDTVRGFFNLASVMFPTGQSHVSVVMGPGTAFGNPHVPAWAVTAVVIAYATVSGWFAARFGWRLHKLAVLCRSAAPLTLAGDAAVLWEQCANRFGVASACLGTCSQICGPITVGIRRLLVLMPRDMLATLPESELRTAIAHEFAHMRRHDFLKNLLYELLSLPVRFHPALMLTRECLMETREMVCDQLASSLADPHRYARSLLRLASLLVEGMPSRTPQAIGIFDANSFERRVMRLMERPTNFSALRRFSTATACTLLGAGLCATTLAFGLHLDAFAAGDEQHTLKAPGPVAVKPDVMQGQIVHKVPPVYPPDAKKARIQGKVQLDVVIGKTGEVEQLKVVSGPKELQQSALDAVRQWTYKPFYVNGAPADVRTTVNVTYSLSH